MMNHDVIDGLSADFLQISTCGAAVAVQLLGLWFSMASAPRKSRHCLIWTLASQEANHVSIYMQTYAHMY